MLLSPARKLAITLVATLALTACSDPDDDPNQDTDLNQETDLNQDTDLNQPSLQGWTILTHPCAGHRTDALHCDDHLTCFVGCGTTTQGAQGLYQTTDGGETWARPSTNPPDVLNAARVNDISRSSDGLLYIAGELTGPTRVASLAPNGDLEIVWDRGTTTDFSFTAGQFRRSDTGRAIANSQTGVDLVYRSSDLDDWESGRGFWSDGDDDDVPQGVQFLRLQTLGDDFYGVGSTISQPPMVFLPKWTGDDFDFHILPLAADGLGAFTGELWDLSVTEDFLLAGGVNQSQNLGVLFIHPMGSGDPTTTDAWNLFDVGHLFPEHTTWIQGVCQANGVLYAVGRESSQSWGFVLRSDDGGESFTDISPYADGATASELSDAYRCHATESGVIVAGADGMFAVFDD